MIKTMKLLFFAFILLPGCGNNSNDKSATNNEKNVADKSKPETATASNTNAQGDDIIGEWQMKYLAQDDNGNHVLDDDERNRANTKMQDYFQFNADGTCLFYFIKNKGRYEIKEKNGKRQLYIYDKDNNAERYPINAVTKNELILGGYGDFKVYDRIK